jgi:hypothetical protein
VQVVGNPNANTELEKERLAWEKEQAAKTSEEAKQARLAALKANPGSWMEYQAELGQDPVVQPWMQPLLAGSKVGQKITEGWATPPASTTFSVSPIKIDKLLDGGVSGSGQSTVNGNNYIPTDKLPELTTPGAQYYARMNPDYQAQFGSYEQARTGNTPEATKYRLWQRAPSGGNGTNVTYTR